MSLRALWRPEGRLPERAPEHQQPSTGSIVIHRFLSAVPSRPGRRHAGFVLVTRFPTSLRPLLDRQHSVVSRGQLLAAGVDDGTTYRSVRAGHWQRLLPGIFLVTPGSPGPEQRRVAAALFAGEPAQLTGLAALHWYGFRSAPATDRVHVLVPHDVHRRSAGFVVVQRALSLDAQARHTGLYWVTSPARAVVDAGRALTELRDVRAIVAEAIRADHTSAPAIEAELRRAARSRTGLARQALSEVLAEVRSAPAAEPEKLPSQRATGDPAQQIGRRSLR